MANIICNKCGLTGDSKCPFCRSIFVDRQSLIGQIEHVMSHRMKISAEGIMIKRYSICHHPGPETDLDILTFLKDVFDALSKEDLKITSCTHDWDFAPFCKSEIDCGHGYEAVLDYMSNAWYRLTDGSIYSPAGNYCSECNVHDIWCRHISEPDMLRDDNDKEAAQIIHTALTAVDEGYDWDYKLYKEESSIAPMDKTEYRPDGNEHV